MGDFPQSTLDVLIIVILGLSVLIALSIKSAYDKTKRK